MGQSRERFYVEFGRRVRVHRERKGWSQDALGQALPKPMTRASIANIEAGQQRVLAHTLCDIAAALGVPVTDLLTPPEKTTIDDQRHLVEELARKVDLSAEKARSIVSKIPHNGGV